MTSRLEENFGLEDPETELGKRRFGMIAQHLASRAGFDLGDPETFVDDYLSGRFTGGHLNLSQKARVEELYNTSARILSYMIASFEENELDPSRIPQVEVAFSGPPIDRQAVGKTVTKLSELLAQLRSGAAELQPGGHIVVGGDGKEGRISLDIRFIRFTPLFEEPDIVLHEKSGKLYRIMQSPASMVLESTGERAYAYQAYKNADLRIWVRSQAEMEDGRFRKVTEKEAEQHIGAGLPPKS